MDMTDGSETDDAPVSLILMDDQGAAVASASLRLAYLVYHYNTMITQAIGSPVFDTTFFSYPISCQRLDGGMTKQRYI